RDEPLAPIIAEALEGYAAARFELQAEVKRFLASHPQYPRDRCDDLRAQRVTNLLKRSVYAGYVEAPDWDVTLRKGDHEPLISFETLRTNQDRLAGNAKTPARAKAERDSERFLDRIAQAERLSVIYVRNEGSRTPDLALPFKLLADLRSSESKLARPE